MSQRLGRCDRFGIGDGEFQIIEKNDKSTQAYLSRVEYSYNTTKRFILFLKEQGMSENKSMLKRREFMDLYYKFQNQHKEFYDKDWERIHKDAIEFYSTYEEFKYINKKKKKIMSSNFRGDSVFILPCILNSDNYVYNVLSEEINKQKTLTLSSNDIDLDAILKNFIEAAKSNHFKDLYGFNFNKYNSKDFIIKSLARDPSTPIFSSFTDNDEKLSRVSNLDSSLFYVPFSKSNKYYGLINKNRIKQ